MKIRTLMTWQIAFATMLCVSLTSMVHAQLIPAGANPFIFQQMDDTQLNPGNNTRALGVGYWGTGPGILGTPQSVLHIYSEALPAGPISNQETFRTTAGLQSQFWRMERSDLEIGRFYHFVTTDHLRIRAVQPTADLILETGLGDGIRICNTNTAPTTLNGFTLDRQGYATLGSANGWSSALAWSRLHLAHEDQGTTPVYGFRSWMRNGVIGISSLGQYSRSR